MRAELLRPLSELPPLDRANIAATAHRCKICGTAAEFFDVTDFYKTPGGYTFGRSGIAVDWFRCNGCQFLFTPFFDDWLANDLARFVYNPDYSHVDPEYAVIRPRRVVDTVARLLGPPRGMRLLDYGGRTSTLTDGLRDRDYDAMRHDFGGSAPPPAGPFDLIICAEVLQHLSDPGATLRDLRNLLGPRGAIFMGQTLQPPDIQTIRANWWSCAPRNGHRSLFSELTLMQLAASAGLRFHAGGTIHGFTQSDIGPVAERISRTIGPALLPVVLGAPADGRVAGWHDTEQSPSGPFRWTAGAKLTWEPAVEGAGVLCISVPVRMAISPDFLQACRLVVDGDELPTQIQDGRLVARMTVTAPAPASLRIQLRTPEPLPARAPDMRMLGLAISVT